VKEYDYLIVGGGIFGIYSALYLSGKKQKVLLVEKEGELMQKASIVNQARLHSGYHYPRSIATARIADEYKIRFTEEHKPFINFKFQQYYAIEKNGSFTNSSQFERFCSYMNIKAVPVKKHEFFDLTRLEELYLTEEYTFDPILIADYYRARIRDRENLTLLMNTHVTQAEQLSDAWQVTVGGPNSPGVEKIRAGVVINATYLGTNTINRLFGLKQIPLMHEITEMVMLSCPPLQEVGLTVMDGHFCSIMPYGLSGVLSLSSVTYTHHKVSYELEPDFDCMQVNQECRPDYVSVCNTCPARPVSNKNKMMKQMKMYLAPNVELNYLYSMFTIKTKLQSSFIDDGRPTEITKLNEQPGYFCLFAGKINSIYEIENKISHV